MMRDLRHSLRFFGSPWYGLRTTNLRRLSGVSGGGISDAVYRDELLKVYKSVVPNSCFGFAQQRSAESTISGIPTNFGAINADTGPSSREVFANNEINLENISVVGIDYDYTAASYRNSVQYLIYNEAVRCLVDNKLYPDELKKLAYDKSFAVRGLSFDKSRGLLFKLDPKYHVDLSNVFRGRTRLNPDEALHFFDGNTHLRSSASQLAGIFDQFSLAEACLLADVCDFFYRGGITFSPGAIYEDVHESIAQVHISGTFHNTVMKNVEKYLHHSPKIRTMFSTLCESGKESFILSNSSMKFVDAGMRYLCGDDWMSLFSAVLTDAQKPGFYSSHNPFRKLDLSCPFSFNTKLRTEWKSVRKLEKLSAYSKGNVSDMIRLTGWKPSEILYIGDHVFADLRGPARFEGWKTGAIIRELDKEIEVERSQEYRTISFQLQFNAEILRRIQWAPTRNGDKESLGDVLNGLESDRKLLSERMNSLFNSNFGSVFMSSSGHGPTLFSTYVSRYVDLYTSRLENFLDYGQAWSYRFYPRKRGLLAHEASFPPIAKYIEASLNRPIDSQDIRLAKELSFPIDDEESVDTEKENKPLL